MQKRTVSLSQYPNKSVPLQNPVDLTKVPRGKTFQVTHPDFILQFFFNKQDLIGIIFKRNKRTPIRMRWCFFKSCEPSKFDYVVTIAESFNPPFAQGFFQVKFPTGIQYQFQGLEFSNK